MQRTNRGKKRVCKSLTGFSRSRSESHSFHPRTSSFFPYLGSDVYRSSTLSRKRERYIGFSRGPMRQVCAVVWELALPMNGIARNFLQSRGVIRFFRLPRTSASFVLFSHDFTTPTRLISNRITFSCIRRCYISIAWDEM